MDLGLLLPLALLIPLLLITFRARRQQRTVLELQQRLVPGQAVITSAGLHGTIRDVEDDVVLLEVADGVRVRWARAAISRIVETTTEPGVQDVPRRD
jgi:preprotein translocase subunit YajC